MDHRILAVSLAVLVLASVVGEISTSKGASAADSVTPSASKLFMIRSTALNVAQLASVLPAGSIVERYGGYILAALTAGQYLELVRAGLDPVDLDGGTVTGRGAFMHDTRLGDLSFPEQLTVDRARDPSYDLYIVQFIGPINGAWIESVRSTGAQVFGYLPQFSYMMALQPHALEIVRRLPFVRWVGLYEPAYKISPELLDLTEGTLAVTVSVLPGRDGSAVADRVARLGGQVLDTWTGWDGARVATILPASGLADLARVRDVSWIEPLRPSYPLNDNATWVVQSNQQNNRIIFDKGLHGNGQIITMADTGLDNFPAGYCHEMFKQTPTSCGTIGTGHRKVVAYYVPTGGTGNSFDDNGHGTHVAGTLIGDSPSGGYYFTYNDHDGQAFEARLIVQDITNIGSVVYPPSDYSNMFTPSFTAGSRIHSDSWGGSGNSYFSEEGTIDSFVWAHPTYLILFAAGNGGPGIETLTNQANAKDIITVGATANGLSANNMAFADSRYFSSPGPAGDGRLKPTLVAPGQGIVSAKSTGATIGCAPVGTLYLQCDGTSMATPAIAGSAALVREYFSRGFYPSGTPNGSTGFEPSSALVKAILINGAAEVTGLEGYGQTTAASPNKVQLSTAYYFTSPASLQALKCANSKPTGSGCPAGTNSYPARATSKIIDFDYASDYSLDIRFFAKADAINPFGDGSMSVVDDGRANVYLDSSTLLVVADGPSGGGTGISITSDTWHRLQINYHPSAGTYDAIVDGTLVGGGGAHFVGLARHRLTIGSTPTVGGGGGGCSQVFSIPCGRSDASPLAGYDTFYGEIFVDSAKYTGPGGSPIYFVDEFDDGDIGDWLKNVGPTAEYRYPNNHQGWGRVLLDNALYFLGDPKQLSIDDNTAGLSTGQSRQYQFNVTGSTQPFEVTLVWSDYPGTPGAGRAIVNDLDLLVTDPQGNQYKGNVFSGYNPGQSAVGGAYDRLNVEEGVLRLTPAVGTWTVSVTGFNIPNGPQPFALVVTGKLQPGSGLQVSISPAAQTVYFNNAGCLLPTASFTGSASGGQAPYTYGWIFGDGGTTTGNPVQHTYPLFEYTWTGWLIVTDSNGAQGSSTATVTVRETTFC